MIEVVQYGQAVITLVYGWEHQYTVRRHNVHKIIHCVVTARLSTVYLNIKDILVICMQINLSYGRLFELVNHVVALVVKNLTNKDYKYLITYSVDMELP